MIHLREFGSGQPLLALHGLSGHGDRWRAFATGQLAGYRVIAPDLRGHGKSSWNPPWNIETYVHDIVGLLDKLELEQVAVLGHSFGGTIATYLGAIAPHRVSKLVLIDPSMSLPAEFGQDGANEAMTAESYGSVEEFGAAQHKRWPFATAEQLADEVEANLVQDDDGRWRRNYNPAMAVVAWSEMTRHFVIPVVPTLLVQALQADYVRPEMVEAYQVTLGDRFTLSEMDCGHMVYFERPDELGKVVTTFLES